MAMLKLYNTWTRQIDPFTPLEGNQVRMYCCGPTVYNYAHIGNFRTFIFEDLLRRTLKFFGHELLHVMNFTDVDDKTIRGAQQAGMSLKAFTDKYAQIFLEDMARLHIEKPEVMPSAVAHIPQMIALIERLLDKGFAYRSDDGSVYYRISAFPDYGHLARLDKEGLQAGARVSQDEYQKESFGDFALWKAWVPEDGEVGWDSPWGKGRPGWHIECSAMSMAILGEQFDLHCGGVDLMFPHHENEIAQSEAATGKKFVKTWMHCAHLLVENQKMSKSLGNLYTVSDVLQRGYTGRELRYALMSTHYRQSLNFTWEEMEAVKAAVARIDEWRARVKKQAGTDELTLAEGAEKFLTQFKAALGDDLNISGALGHWFDFIRETNKAMDQGKFWSGWEKTWQTVDAVLGLGELQVAIPAEIQGIANERQAARQAKDFKKSDELRAVLEQKGWLVKDTPQGQELKKK